MKIKWNTMLGTNHSWSFVSQYLIRAMKNVSNHDIFLRSTNGLEHFPEDLKENLLCGHHNFFVPGVNEIDFVNEKREIISVHKDQKIPNIHDPNEPYDVEFAYAAPVRWADRFNKLSKMKAVIWNFESSIMPAGFHLYHNAVDYVLPSSQYCYDVFAANGIPKDKMLVVPHGVDLNMFNENIAPFKFKTEKKVKFLHNAIPHYRKLHERVIGGYLDAFTGDDDVCLILKTKFVSQGTKDKLFERDLFALLTELYDGRDNPPEIEIVTDYVDDIGSLYTGVDAVVSMSASEGFWMPGLEALACGALVIAPRYSGQLDFLNDDNSLLVNCDKEMPAPNTMQYWTFMEDSVVGDPDQKHFSELLRRVYENPDKEKERIRESAKETSEKFSWENAAKMMLDLPIPEKNSQINVKRKILYIIPYNIAGGGETWVREAVNQLDKRLYEPHIAFINGNDALMDMFKDVEAKKINLKNNGYAMGLKSYIESNNFNIVHFYNSFFVYNIIKDIFKAGHRFGVVETVHSELEWNDSMTKVAKREGFVTAIISVSNHMAKKLINNGNGNIFIMPQPINWERFEKPRSKSILKDEGIKTDFVVGFVGRISAEKNILTILKSAQYLPNVSFVLIGDGPQRKDLQKISSKLENVHWLGSKSNVEEYYPAFDIMLLPSLIEGLPLVIIEAMASGTPTISSDVGGVSEIIMNGFNGKLLLNKSNDKELAMKIKEMMSEDLSKYQEGCKSIYNVLKEKSKLTNINNIYGILFGDKK